LYFRLSDERIYDSRDRTSSCNDYERIVERDSPYIKRNISYLDDSDYSNRSRSRDRPFSRNVNNSYGDGIERFVMTSFTSVSFKSINFYLNY
jgi:hypothetical protein